MEDASRVFWTKRSVDSDSGNDDTLFATGAISQSGRPFEGELFFEHYDAIRDWVGKHGEPGLGVVVLSGAGIEAKAYLHASKRSLNTAILGRYAHAEISLPGDPSLSLRHLAVIVAPYLGHGRPEFRLIDLRTTLGFTDPSGRNIRTCASDGACFIRCGSYSVLFASTSNDRFRWPDEPEDMWPDLRRKTAETSAALPAVRLSDPLLYDGEDPLGELLIRSRDGVGKILVGRRAARAGVLLGRSDRCDGDALLANPHISRVHLLIVEIAGRVYAIDTASKNGVWGRAGGHRARLLESGTRLSLSGRATIEWRFFH